MALQGKLVFFHKFYILEIQIAMYRNVLTRHTWITNSKTSVSLVTHGQQRWGSSRIRSHSRFRLPESPLTSPGRPRT